MTNFILIQLLVTAFYGPSAPVHTHSMSLLNQGMVYSKDVCQAQAMTKPTVLLNSENWQITHNVNGLCVPSVPEHDASHYVAFIINPVLSGYEIQFSKSIVKIPAASREDAEEIQRLVAENLVPPVYHRVLTLSSYIIDTQ